MQKHSKPRPPTKRQRAVAAEWAAGPQQPVILAGTSLHYEIVDMDTAKAIRACLVWGWRDER